MGFHGSNSYIKSLRRNSIGGIPIFYSTLSKELSLGVTYIVLFVE
jgi:hypothetical protein